MIVDDRLEMARNLAQVAADLEHRGYPNHGIIRQAARAIIDGGFFRDDKGCVGCGRELSQPATGRRRRWCSEKCRRRHRP